ncbi:MAG: sporulation membrane protein YtaF [Acetivibrionales bacterium]|jgi:putative sporulation protein YtaF
MIFYIIILAISLSIDALGAGIIYGMRNIKIPFISEITICVFSIVYTSIALIAGKSLYNALSPLISRAIGVIILTAMGIWIVVQSLLKEDINNRKSRAKAAKDRETLFKLVIKSLGITIQVIKNPARGDIDKSGIIDIKESLLLGLALSVDAIGVGIGSVLAGFRSALLPLMVGLFQLIFLYSGACLGKKFSSVGKANRKALSLLPGFILIFLAILRLF